MIIVGEVAAMGKFQISLNKIILLIFPFVCKYFGDISYNLGQ